MELQISGFFLGLRGDDYFLGLLGAWNRWFCGFCFIKVKILMLIVVGVVAEWLMFFNGWFSAWRGGMKHWVFGILISNSGYFHFISIKKTINTRNALYICTISGIIKNKIKNCLIELMWINLSFIFLFFKKLLN